MSTAPRPLLLTGVVRHRRLRPALHAFDYPTFQLLLPLRALAARPCPALHRNRRFAALAFHDRDHGDGGGDALAWLVAVLAAHGVDGADGEVWLQTYPRVFGFAFKPVSFWYCERADGTLAAVVAEVNNTFGERHCYLLDGPRLAWGREQHAAKVFHVSPFCRPSGGYRFRFLRTAARLVARVEHDDDAGPLLRTSVSGRLTALTPASARAALWRMPLLTAGVLARIHWQALRLMLRRVPFVAKPAAPPSSFVTR